MNISKWTLISILGVFFSAGFFGGVISADLHLRYIMHKEFKMFEHHGPGPRPGFGFGPDRGGGPKPMPDPEIDQEMRERLLGELTRGLKLNATQQGQIKQIFASHATEFQRVRDSFREEMLRIVTTTDQEIIKCLTEEQRKVFEKKRMQFKP